MATNIVGDGANANPSGIDSGAVLTEAQVANINASNWDIERRFALIAMSRTPDHWPRPSAQAMGTPCAT